MPVAPSRRISAAVGPHLQCPLLDFAAGVDRTDTNEPGASDQRAAKLANDVTPTARVLVQLSLRRVTSTRVAGPPNVTAPDGRGGNWPTEAAKVGRRRCSLYRPQSRTMRYPITKLYPASPPTVGHDAERYETVAATPEFASFIAQTPGPR